LKKEDKAKRCIILLK